MISNDDFELPIKQIYVVNSQGTNFYEVGMGLNGSVVDKILHTTIIYTGDPFSRYCGFDSNGKILFSLEPNMPLDIQYL